MTGDQDPKEARRREPGWFELVFASNLMPEVPLVVLAAVSLLTVLPAYEAIQFLHDPGPFWAYGLAGLWVLLAGRFLWHLDQHRLDKRDISFLVVHLVISAAVVFQVLRATRLAT